MKFSIVSRYQGPVLSIQVLLLSIPPTALQHPPSCHTSMPCILPSGPSQAASLFWKTFSPSSMPIPLQIWSLAQTFSHKEWSLLLQSPLPLPKGLDETLHPLNPLSSCSWSLSPPLLRFCPIPHLHVPEGRASGSPCQSSFCLPSLS